MRVAEHTMKPMRILIPRAFVAAWLVLVAACESPADPPPICEFDLKIVPEIGGIFVGQQGVFTGRVHAAYARCDRSGRVAWDTSDEAVIAVTPLSDSTALLQAVSVGYAVITARIDDARALTDTLPLYVIARGSAVP